MTTIVGLCLLVAVALGIRHARQRLVLVLVCGNSMAPTLRDGDLLLVRRTLGRSLRRGEVVVFANPRADGDLAWPQWLVKRVTALAGDEVPTDDHGGVRVPEGCYYVRGDNADSLDSRHFGYVRSEAVLGVPLRPNG